MKLARISGITKSRGEIEILILDRTKGRSTPLETDKIKLIKNVYKIIEMGIISDIYHFDYRIKSLIQLQSELSKFKFYNKK